MVATVNSDHSSYFFCESVVLGSNSTWKSDIFVGLALGWLRIPSCEKSQYFGGYLDTLSCRSILRHKYTFACLVWTTLITLTKKIANVITINRGNHLNQPESTFKTNWGYYRCKRWFLFWQDTDQYEVIKRTIFATFSHHKYFQTSIGISRGLHLTNKLLKVILTIWMLIFDDYMWRRRWLKVGEFSR